MHVQHPTTNGRADRQHLAFREYFDSTTEHWDSIYEGESFVNRHMRDRKHTILSIVDYISQGRKLCVLDLGSGTGIQAKSLVERGHSVVALDCSQNMLQKLYTSLKQKRPQFLGAVCALGNETCFRGEQFDLILCAGVLQYQPDEELLIKEINRLLKKGGFCIFTLPNLFSINHLADPVSYVRSLRRLWARCLLRKEKYASNTGWFRVVGTRTESQLYNKQYALWEVPRLLQKYGLVLRKVVGLGFGPLTFRQREILPEDWSISLSEQLTKISRKVFLRWLRYCANRWVFAVQRI